MKTVVKIKSFALIFILTIFFSAVTVPVVVSEMTLNDNLNISGKIFLEGSGCGVNFPDGSRQTTAGIPPWHQRFSDDRFVLVLDDKGVLDRETGLVWQRAAADDPQDWYAAQRYCYNLELGGRKGWHLPTIYELQTLIDSTQSNPALPAEHLFVGTTNNLSNFYWSSTTALIYEDEQVKTNKARIILFANGDGQIGLKTNDSSGYVRAVRLWSQKVSDGRFELVLDDEAVLDLETGLVWQKESDDILRDWYKAQDYCSNLEIGGRKGWRLPTIDELATLVDSNHNPALPEGHPFIGNDLSSHYWSSTTYAYNTGYAWLVHFYGGGVNDGYKTDSYYVRAVRSGQ